MGSGKPRQAVKKYLAGHSESEASRLNNIQTQYSHTLVIPLYDESFEAVNRLLNTHFSVTNSESRSTVLFILVVNCPEDGRSEAEARTVYLLRTLEASLQSLIEIDNLTYGELENGRGVIIVDRCSEERQIPTKQGVGLARKIGADLACYLIATGTIKNRWIHSTDADVTLPANYFDGALDAEYTESQSSEVPVALVYPFKHLPESGYEIASELYDWSLRYYVECLKWAGSGYAYHTIGSLIAVDFEAYAKVRGFPKRSGGEDFYLLNKLAKVGQIKSLNTPVIKVAARPSQRVPFGTGPALCRITENQNAVIAHLFYHPEIFYQLKLVLFLINKAWTSSGNLTADSAKDILWVLKPSVMLGSDYMQIIEALEVLGFTKAWKHAVKQSSNEQQYVKQMTVWFDAFRTLKFVHYMRDHGYPSLPLKDVLKKMPVLTDELMVKAAKLISITAE